MADKPIRLPRQAGVKIPLAEHRDRGLTPFERETLEKLHVAPHEIAEGGLDRIVKAVLEEDARALQHESPVDPATPAVKLDESQVTPIDRLTPEQRDRVLAKIQSMKSAVADVRPPSPAASNVPGLSAAVAASASAPTCKTRDDAPAPAADDAGTGIDMPVKHCPRCKWDLRRSDLLDVTREDKLAWIASLHGARYRKSYTLLDGHLQVVFRSITSKETEAVFHQTRLDFQDRAIDFGAFTSEAHQYRLTLSLESVSFSDGVKLVVPAPAAAAGDPGLKALREYVAASVLASESLARVVYRKFADFQRLIEWMEENSDNPDFMKEISALS